MSHRMSEWLAEVERDSDSAQHSAGDAADHVRLSYATENEILATGRALGQSGLRRTANSADFTFAVDGVELRLRVVRFEGKEGLNALFEFTVELVSDDPALELDALLMRPCTLAIRHTGGQRLVRGIVRDFEYSGEGSRLTHYRASIVPIHWLLTQRQTSRIFQAHVCPDMSVPGIVCQVLSDAQIPPEQIRLALEREYPPREYVVQYRETDFDFVARLLEEEGIAFHFQHDERGHQMVLTDARVGHVVLPEAAEYPYRQSNGLAAEREFVYGLRDLRRIRMGAVRVDDFDFKRPAYDLASSSAASRDTGLEFNDYPHDYVDKAIGQRYAQIRLEERQCRRRTVELRATARGLTPGYVFALAEHPVVEVCRGWLVTRVEHVGSQRSGAENEALSVDDTVEYAARVQAIPDDVAFRPERTTPRPFVHGSQTAIVVGPQMEEIHTDAHGRVKVQFHWDRTGKYDALSSCWIRVSQGMAGGQYGMMFLPRVGQEVIVDFLEGNPDRPIITGRVYNADHMPPYSLPDSKTRSCIKTRSTRGGNGSNEIRFEDAQGSEQLLFHAQKDLHVRTLNDRLETIERDQHLLVRRDQVEQVDGNHHLTLGGSRCEQISGETSLAVMGMVSIRVDGTHSTTVARDVVERFGADHRHEVAATHATHATNIKLEASQTIELKCGGSSIVLTPTAIYIAGPLVNINSGAGPQVTGPVAQATCPAPPARPLEADRVAYGHDTRYDQANCAPPPCTTPSAGTDVASVAPATEKSWIEIELVDECGLPVAGEKYELQLPDGRRRASRLDARGFARVDGIQPGSCMICFPNLDAEAWERI
ncbi:MAG: type VI secretion system tip protein TssI/VgrG [Phycisphaerae bacterium]